MERSNDAPAPPEFGDARNGERGRFAAFHTIKDIKIEEVRKKKDIKRGRPKNNEELQVMSNAKASFSENDDKVKRALLGKGKFILATNELEKLSDEEVLKQYKDQQSVERGFRFLKDPLFFTHSIFLKNESRIVALVMIMGLALLIYSIAQKKLREALLRENQMIPDQNTCSLQDSI
ncbi:MAG: IS1634 family transposase [Acidimicrobiia bacterium]|nr:IS1634 family transposase [Acidimicrobiia bacterium]